MSTTRRNSRKAESNPPPGPRTAPAGKASGGRPLPYAPASRTADRDSALERWLHGGVTLEEACRVRAYQLWERAGRPPGDGVAFWLEAERELTAGG